MKPRPALVFLLLLGACAGPDKAYLAAERATYDAIAPEYLRYVDADPQLDAAEKQRRHLTVESWDARLTAAEGGGQ